jgi:hypothetical protein
VDEDYEPRLGVRERRRERFAVGRDDPATEPHRHRLLQLRSRLLQRVADQAVQHRQRGRAARGSGDRPAVAGIVPAQRAVGDTARERGGAAHRAVDAARDRVVREPYRVGARPQRAEHAARDRVVHTADPAGAAAQP